MKKPTKQILEYYDWDSVEKYLIENKIWTEDLASELWYELCDSNQSMNGRPFTISDWEFKHNNGKFMYTLSECKKQAIPSLLEHFGEPDKECLDPGVLTATFISSW